MLSNLTDSTLLKLSDGKRILMDKSIGLLRILGEVIGERMVMLKFCHKIKVLKWIILQWVLLHIQ
jgi:hypothetical protein